jgi:hypothetical protein
MEGIAAAKAKGSTNAAWWMSALPPNVIRQILPEKRNLCYSFLIRRVRSYSSPARRTRVLGPSIAVGMSGIQLGISGAQVFFV